MTLLARRQKSDARDAAAIVEPETPVGLRHPVFPTPAAPSRIPTPSDHLTPTAAVAVSCSALWCGFSPPVTPIREGSGVVEEALRQSVEYVSIDRTTGTGPHGAPVMPRPIRFAILIYDDVEPIDIGATYGVLSMARRVAPEIEMFLVAARAGPVRAANGLVVQADYGYGDCPEADVLLVTGGPGWTQMAGDTATLAFVRGRAGGGKRGQAVASVCTGGMILAAAGLLDGLHATTKREVVGDEASPLGLLGRVLPRGRSGGGTLRGHRRDRHRRRGDPRHRRDPASHRAPVRPEQGRGDGAHHRVLGRGAGQRGAVDRDGDPEHRLRPPETPAPDDARCSPRARFVR